MFTRTHILWAHRRILWVTTRADIESRFTGTVFGRLWMFLYPILFLGLYAVVYTMIFKVRLGGYSTSDYVLLIFCGLIPFLGFSEALSGGVGSVIGNKGLIRNTMFPIELIPVKSVLSGSMTMIVGLILLLAVLWAHGIVHLTQLALPLILTLQLIFTVGLIWIFSAINVFVPDLSQTVSVLILFLMLVSPIAYTREMIPAALMPFMYPNPLYYLIMLYRGAAFIGTIDVRMLAIFSCIALCTFSIGGYLFSRLKSLFADYV